MAHVLGESPGSAEYQAHICRQHDHPAADLVCCHDGKTRYSDQRAVTGMQLARGGLQQVLLLTRQIAAELA